MVDKTQIIDHHLIVWCPGCVMKINLSEEDCKTVAKNWALMIQGEEQDYIFPTGNGYIDLSEAFAVTYEPIPVTRLTPEEEECRDFAVQAEKTQREMIQLLKKKFKEENRGENWRGDDDDDS